MEQILREKLSKVLFHGTLMDRAASIVYDGINFDKLNDRADFGKGFYLTDSYALAKDTALTRYNQVKQSTGSAYPPVVLRVKVNCNSLSDYKIKEFLGESDEWKKFVCCNRWYKEISKFNPLCEHNTNLEYDIVIGLTADGKINTLDRLIKEDNYKLSDDFIKKIKPYITIYSKITNGKNKKNTAKAYQISFHNPSFIKSCIKYKSYDIIRLEKEDGYYE